MLNVKYIVTLDIFFNKLIIQLNLVYYILRILINNYDNFLNFKENPILSNIYLILFSTPLYM